MPRLRGGWLVVLGKPTCSISLWLVKEPVVGSEGGKVVGGKEGGDGREEPRRRGEVGSRWSLESGRYSCGRRRRRRRRRRDCVRGEKVERSGKEGK